MASGYDKNKARLNAIQLLGKELSRRAKSRCELCEETGRSLRPQEIPPLPDHPSSDTTILVCENCVREQGARSLCPDYWRPLSSVMWTEVTPAQVAAVRLLRRLALAGTAWAQEALDGLYLESETETWIDAHE